MCKKKKSQRDVYLRGTQHNNHTTYNLITCYNVVLVTNIIYSKYPFHSNTIITKAHTDFEFKAERAETIINLTLINNQTFKM